MSRTTSVTLGEPLNNFVNRMVETGRYGSSSEVIRSGLRLLEEREQAIAQLNAMLEEGLNSGESNETFDDIVNRVRSKMSV